MPKSRTQPPHNTVSGEAATVAHRKAGRPREIEYALEKKFTLMMPKDLHKALKIKAAELEAPMTTIIIEAIKKTYNI
jgi:predicted HicB family RNase H-like nuclease